MCQIQNPINTTLAPMAPFRLVSGMSWHAAVAVIHSEPHFPGPADQRLPEALLSIATTSEYNMLPQYIACVIALTYC